MSGRLAVAHYLKQTNGLKRFGERYIARQEMQMGRDGRVAAGGSMTFRRRQPADSLFLFGEHLRSQSVLRGRDFGVAISVQRFMRARHEGELEARGNAEGGERDDSVTRSEMAHGIRHRRAHYKQLSELVLEREYYEAVVALLRLIRVDRAYVRAHIGAVAHDRAVGMRPS
jgi:hypothetical protein